MLAEKLTKVLVVIKLGGSLYDYAPLQDVLTTIQSWFQSGGCYSGGVPLLIPGGGAAADVVRNWQKHHHIEEEQAHWLACDALEWNARVIQSVLTSAQLVDNLFQTLNAWERGFFPILRTSTALHLAESSLPEGIQPEPLPHNWDVTSDSIAAWFACQWQAQILLLCKSIPLPENFTATDASKSGLVDPYFPGLAGYIPQIDWCFARCFPPVKTPWLHDGYAAH